MSIFFGYNEESVTKITLPTKHDVNRKMSVSPRLAPSFMPKFVERQILVQDAVLVKTGFGDGSGGCFCLLQTMLAVGVTDFCYLPYPDPPRNHEQAQPGGWALVVFNDAQGLVMSR